MKTEKPENLAFVRRATKTDVPRMLELVKELALFEKAPAEVTVTLDHFTEAGFGENPVYKAWVVQEGDLVPAFALCYIRYSTWKGSMLYLEDLYVTESRRSAGLGRLLFEACLEEVKTEGLQGMVWQVLNWNQAAITFYEKFGSHFDAEWITCSLGPKELEKLEKLEELKDLENKNLYLEQKPIKS